MKCPNCQSQMVERKRRSDGHPFMGCASYPKCNYTREIDRPDDPTEIDVDIMSDWNVDVGDR